MIRSTRWFIVDDDAKTFKSKRKARTLPTAFDKSIKNWELRTEGYQADNSVITCGLCDLFKRMNKTCLKCPITDYTGFRYCRGNIPYINYCDSKNKQIRPKLAIREMEFLKFLQSIYVIEAS